MLRATTSVLGQTLPRGFMQPTSDQMQVCAHNY